MEDQNSLAGICSTGKLGLDRFTNHLLTYLLTLLTAGCYLCCAHPFRVHSTSVLVLARPYLPRLFTGCLFSVVCNPLQVASNARCTKPQFLKQH